MEKTSKALIGAGLCVAGLLAATSAQANLIVNPGFETGGPSLPSTHPGVGGGWYQSAINGNYVGQVYSGSVTIDGNPQSGSHAAALAATSAFNTEQLFQDISLPVGQSEVVSFWGKDTVGGNFIVNLDGVTVSTTPLSSTYTQYTYTVTPTKFGTQTLSFTWVGIANGATAYVDNVSVTPVPEASTVVAGALLLLPLGASTLRILRKTRTA